MGYYSEKFVLLLIGTFILSSSCSNEKISFSSNTNIKKEIDFTSKAIVSINITTNNGLKVQSSDSVSEAKLSDIKSFSVFLTTNPAAPFAIGDNPLGNGVVFSTNNVSTRVFKFVNVPRGGPYYAVLSAFDGLGGLGNNLAEPNAIIISGDNKWHISNDTVIVLPSGVPAFSNSNNALNINLVLRKPIANSITSEITIINGGNRGGDVNVN